MGGGEIWRCWESACVSPNPDSSVEERWEGTDAISLKAMGHSLTHSGVQQPYPPSLQRNHSSTHHFVEVS